MGGAKGAGGDWIRYPRCFGCVGELQQTHYFTGIQREAGQLEMVTGGFKFRRAPGNAGKPAVRPHQSQGVRVSYADIASGCKLPNNVGINSDTVG